MTKKIAAYKKRCEARRAEIKRGLVQHLNHTTSSGDYTEVKIALLEIACELTLEIHDEEHARDLIDRAETQRPAAMSALSKPMRQALELVEHMADSDVCIIARETSHGYWWRYRHSKDEPRETLTAAIMIAGEVAATEARKRGKTYLVARAAAGADTVYVFACDHPDARNAALDVMFEYTRDGGRIRRPGPRAATRH